MSINFFFYKQAKKSITFFEFQKNRRNSAYLPKSGKITPE